MITYNKNRRSAIFSFFTSNMLHRSCVLVICREGQQVEVPGCPAALAPPAPTLLACPQPLCHLPTPPSATWRSGFSHPAHKSSSTL